MNDHDHHHHDEHHHHHEPGQGMSFAEKLTKLLDHWIAHNESHVQSYREWEQKAQAEGHLDTAALLGNIAELSDRITEKLKMGRQLQEEE